MGALLRHGGPLLAAGALLAGCGSGATRPPSSAPAPASSSSGTSTTAPPTAASSLLAPLAGPRTSRIDGVRCQGSEQLAIHRHAHLAVYVGGQPRAIPGGIGIAPPLEVEQTAAGPYVVGGSCFFWLHTHGPDGIVHIEAPADRRFTLGQLFDEWGEPLGPTEVGPAEGPVTAYLDGHRVAADPRRIGLTAHAVIQLDVGTPVALQPFSFPPGL